MPSTSFNITMLQRAIPNFSRQQILEAWNDVVQTIYAENMAQTMARDTDGLPPLLPTTAGTKGYSPADTLCREIEFVLCEVPADAPGYGQVRDRSGYSSSDTVAVAGKLFWKVPVTAMSAVYGTPASLIFVNDPGDTTDVYRVLYYKKHTPISTEAIATQIPEELHGEIRKAVLAMLNTESYGETGLQDQIFENTISKIRKRMNRGAKARVGRTPVQMQDNIARSTSSYGYGRGSLR